MTINAPNFALVDLSQNSWPTIRLVDKAMDCLALLRWINMVEVEDNRVDFAAVDARMGGNVLQHLCF